MNSDIAVAPLAAKLHKVAEARCKKLNERLTPARLAAYAELVASAKPLSAYELIASLEKRQDRKIAPLTVYRHLDFLTRVGLVHRLESTQSYMPCEHPEHTHESQYLVCSDCGQVKEVESKRLSKLLEKIAAEFSFQAKNSVIEVEGLCKGCASTTPDSA